MKDPYQVLIQKEKELELVQGQIDALHLVIPLLAEDADWIENGLALPVSKRATGTESAKAWP